MSWFSDFFRNLFGRKQPAPQPTPPAPAWTPPPPLPIAPQAPQAAPAPSPPVPTPPTPVAPATPAPYPPPGTPPGDVFYNEKGLPDPKGMYRDYQVAAVLAQQQDKATAMATGPLNPASLTRIDLCYLSVCAAEMTFDARNLGQGLFYGPEVSTLGSQKDGWPEMSAARGNFAAFEATVSPAVVNTVWQMAGGTILPWMNAAFPTILGNERLKSEYLASWSRGWQRLHGSTT